MANYPPKILNKMLEWIISDNEREGLAGDYGEIFSRMTKDSSYTRALLWYVWEIIKLIPINIMGTITWSLTMFNNYFKIAFRNLSRQKLYSFLNITGLAIGMAATIIIVLYVKGELSYDKQNINHERVYRLERMYYNQDGSVAGGFSSLAPSFAVFLNKDFPEFEKITRFVFAEDQLFTIGDKNFTEHNTFLADENIFKIFTLPMISGNSETALSEPFSVVISESIAEKFFGKQNPMGKEIIAQRSSFKVTGVVENMPFHSHIHFDVLISYNSLRYMFDGQAADYYLGDNNFSDNVTHIYTLLRKGTDLEALKVKMPNFVDKYLNGYEDKNGNQRKASEGTFINFRNLDDIHLYSNTRNEIEPGGNIIYVNTFILVAVFVLLIACFNFMNLSTARATKRAKEVGLRKVIGANKKLLIVQFIGESFLIAFIGLIISLAFVYLLLPYFNSFLNVNMVFNLFSDVTTLIILICVLLITGLISGIYPAFYISSYDPAMILRGEISKGKKAAFFRKALVVTQFAVSIALIASVGVVRDQVSYLQSRDLGYRKDNVLLIPLNNELREKWNDFKNNLTGNRNILSASVSKRVPSGQLNDSPGFEIMLNDEWQRTPVNAPHNRVGFDFFKTFGIQFVAGRDFDPTIASDSNEAFIFNETAVKRLGYANPEDIIGTQIKLHGYDGRKNGVVIGVVKDFHYESLHEKIKPILTYIHYPEANTIAIRISGTDIPETISFINQTINMYNPGTTISYEFLDDRLAALYKNEDDMMMMFGYFSLFAVIIACLGLFGLASYTAEQKTKEIGIRKVHGASVSGLTVKLTKQFILWVIISGLIGIPTTYYFMSQWLEDFSYRTELKIITLCAPLLVAIVIAVITVSYQTIKAARSNPIRALRYE